MPKEKSAGAIIYRVEQGTPVYLLLHYPFSGKSTKEYWDLPKGHMEKGETEEDTVRREVQEETGLADINFFDGFREEIHYWFQWQGKTISKNVVFFLAETKQDAIVISEEHIGFRWLPYAEALQQLTYENAKGTLTKAHNTLSAKSI
jgi:8-oxo-dGTP pyrophosphatase MutT (NUDIX family)